MVHTAAFVFPQTIPNLAMIVPLVHIFSELVYLEVIEDDPDLCLDRCPWQKKLKDENRLSRYIPLPLGKNRDRFLALIGEIRTRKSDYMQQLSALLLATLAADTSMESKNSILSGLRGKTSAAKNDNQAKDEVLWQARLLLKLGEILDSEQEDISRQLAVMEQKEEELLQALRGDKDTLFPLTKEIMGSATASDNMASQRVRAWSQLFTSCSRSTENSASFFVTDHHDTVEQLVEKHSAKGGVIAPPITITLPQIEQDSLRADLSLPQASVTLTTLCHKMLADTLSPAEQENLLHAWNEEYRQLTQGYDRSAPVQLTLYKFVHCQAAVLLQETFVDNITALSPANSKALHCVFGYVQS
ncbi:MAG: hypothetical protein CSA32_02295 [Desulfobulbus propionicus]|nr:MAG: hypothetical protein CSA32_02295 [Desulfobulbus propionicus]